MSSAIANGLAGAGGGIIAQIITYPLQTVNTRQQTERIAKKGLVASSNASERPSGGTLRQILLLIKTEGWGGLYSGLTPSLFGTAASQGIYYYFYQLFKNKAEAIAIANKRKGRGDGTVGMFSWLIVAALAGSLNVLLTNPIWVLVTRMQTHTQAERKIMEAKREAIMSEASECSTSPTLQEKLAELDSIKPHPYGTFHAAREVYMEAGITGFWKGIVPTLIMVCNPSIQFMIYEGSQKHLRKKRAAKKQGFKNLSALEVFLLGALAKLGATVSTYPLLVVKSRLQAKQEIGGNISLRYSGTLDAIIKMIRYEGLPGFYKGMSTKIVQSVFAASVLFMIKEELVKAYMLMAVKIQEVAPNLIK
ncbi:peroxisomal nicotinamide adenine dinucleotide carrier-like isoform X1 [Mangifera indica]|uniref:peroxisomal nicotinamide adenine dinucleotide carrier-like isoform X1 n=1 Tax=Mangifera indica TaxID=29780 RepID=UPI001CF98143|nr:peroxisomal nicotinamide adenine dinucleotide carrier-like isoform X1 [Mangifera indica]XP_044507404.1 peroxisomal nicotinamide adenine dinucleotide carrier-like isoform X1 [Mangifera indica]XP_044507405.1 peroxisomal nicotinamide adenine dinucleotide carrier-like isoform X1 [Mangifera indica]